MNASNYVSQLHQRLNTLGDELIAKQMSAYMKNRFEFFGIQKPRLETYWKEFQSEYGKPDSSNFREIATVCMEYSEREMWYLGLDILIKFKKKLEKRDISIVRTIIIRGDWWDIVDLTATHLLGTLCHHFPEISSSMEDWIRDSNMWIRRSALLYQLKYKDQVDSERLYRFILYTSLEEDFFIRKAIGWSLREYSKFNPKSVLNFIETHKDNLSNLSIKEGSKYL